MNDYQGYGATGAAHGTANNYSGNLSGSLVTPELLHSFVVEVKGYLPRIESGLAEYFSYPTAMERLAEAHGYAHTIKKAAHVIGMTALANIAERLESLLEKLATGAIPHNVQTAQGFHQIVTQLGIYLDHSAVGGAVPPTELIEAIYLVENPEAARTLAPAATHVAVPVEPVSPPQLYVLSEEFAETAQPIAPAEVVSEPATYFAEPTVNARNSGRLTTPGTSNHVEPQPIKADLPPVYVLTHTVSVSVPPVVPDEQVEEPVQFETAQALEQPLEETSIHSTSIHSTSETWQPYVEPSADAMAEHQAEPPIELDATPYSVTQQLPSIPPMPENMPLAWQPESLEAPEAFDAPLPTAFVYESQPMAEALPIAQSVSFAEETQVTPAIEYLPEPLYADMEPLRTTQEFPAIKFDQISCEISAPQLEVCAPASFIEEASPMIVPIVVPNVVMDEIPSPPPPPPFPVVAPVMAPAVTESLDAAEALVQDAVPTQPLPPLPEVHEPELAELPIEPLFASEELSSVQESRPSSRLAERLSESLSLENKSGDMASSGSLFNANNAAHSRSDWATRYAHFDAPSLRPVASVPEIVAAETTEPEAAAMEISEPEISVTPIIELLAASEPLVETPISAAPVETGTEVSANVSLVEEDSQPVVAANIISWEGEERARTPFDATTVWGQYPVDLPLPETFAWESAFAAPPIQSSAAEVLTPIAPLPFTDEASAPVQQVEAPMATPALPAMPVIEEEQTASPLADLLGQLSPFEDTRQITALEMPAQEAPVSATADEFAASYATALLAERADDFLELENEDDFAIAQAQPTSATAVEWEVPAELLEVFLPEAEEHLTVITTLLPKLATQSDHKGHRGMLQEIRRSAHSLKGSSAVVGFHGITKLAHRMEDLLDLLYEGEMLLTPEMLDLLFSSTEALENLLNSKSEPEMIGSLYAAYDRILNVTLEAAAPSVVAAESEPVAEPVAEEPSWQNDFNVAPPVPQLTPLPSLTAALSESLAQRALALAEEQVAAMAAEPLAEPIAPVVAAPISEPVAVMPAMPAITTPYPSAPAIPVAPVAAPATPTDSDALSTQAGLINRGNYVRVPIERLDSVVKLVTELIVNRATLEQNMGQFIRQLEELRGNAQRLSRVANRMEVQYEASTLGSGLQGFKANGATFANALNAPAKGGLNAMLNSPVVTQNNYGFDALEFDRYTEFHLLLRELTECSGDMQTMERELRTIREYFESALNRQGRLNSEMQDQLMRLRMVPLASLSSRLHRTAHQVAQQRNKQVNFIIEGEDTRLDKTVIEEMADPLLHILRNAIDHGIEPAAARQALNKPAQGTVKLRAYHEGTQTVIQISDDGGGLNPERLLAKAMQAGIITPAEAAKLTEEEIFALIFIPGFSTASEISEISGRGVGMDIVKTTIQRLKGRIHLDSKVGAGTICTIRLPMTLAVMRALLVKAHKQTFAIPPVGLQQIVKLTPQMLDRVGEQQVVRVNNKLYPLMQLGRLLNLKRQAPPEGTQLALLMNLEDRHFAIAVDETLGGRDVVVKNLGNHIREVRGITGTTLMGDGSAVLILNLPELVRDSLHPTSALTARLSGQQPVIQRPRVMPPTEQRGPLGIMIVDDSLSVRRVLSNRLTSVGWKAIQAKDGLDALEQLQHNPLLPDVILLDIEMPRMDGYEFLSALRKNAAYVNIPVVMITSRAGQKHRDRAFEAGANEYLVKPYQDEELLTLIRKLARDEQAA